MFPRTTHTPEIRRRLIWLWSTAFLFSLAAPAWAVIPGLTGPIQAIAQLLPQILPFLVAGLAGLFSIPAWRERLKRWAVWMITPRGMGISAVVLAVSFGLAYVTRGGGHSHLAAGAAAPATSGTWSMFRGNLGRTGSEGQPGPAEMPPVAWTFSDPEARSADFSSSPAVAGSRVFIGSGQASVFDSSGMVYAIDCSTGKRVWQYRTDKQVFSSPSVADGRVYVGEGLHTDTGCKIYCLDAARGSVLWSVKTKSHTESSPALLGGRVYMGAGDDGIYCLDAERGTVIWHIGGMHVDASPVVADGKVFLGTGYGRLQALALDAASGKTVWSTSSPLAVWGPPCVAGDRVYFGTGDGDFVKSAPLPKGAVWCLDAKTGKQVWRRDLPDAVVTAIVSQGDRICAGSRDGNAYALDAANGSITWKAPCGGPVVASPATDGARVYAAGGGKLHALNLTDGQSAWSFDVTSVAGGSVNLFSSPTVVDGKIYFGTNKGKLLCLGK